MKFIRIASLVTAITISFFPIIAKAESTETSNCVMEPQPYIPSGTLANMAYRGAFKEEGIPGYGVLQTEFNSGKITSEKIVEAAIKACYLSNKYGMGEHPQYVEDVKNQLRFLLRGN